MVRVSPSVTRKSGCITTACWTESRRRHSVELGSTEEDTPMKTFISLSVAAITAVMLTATAQAASPQTSASTNSAPASILTADTTMVVSHGYAHVRKAANTSS